MSTIFFLILFPLAVAFVLLAVRADALRDAIVKIAAAVIAAGSVFLAVTNMSVGTQVFDFECEWLGEAMMVIETLISIALFILGIKHKKYLVPLLVCIQTPLMIWFEMSKAGEIAVQTNLYLDELSIVMSLIIGIVGSLICVYATGYMKDFQHHHEGEPDRRPWFFFLMFIFLSAMFGIVTCNNLLWMFFFWEITTVCSFFLIGYTRTEEAVNNSFRQLILNLIGGLAFALGIVTMGMFFDTVELSTLIGYGIMGYGSYVVIPTAFLALAGIVKAAQMPFHSWLLGAMVAPTPTSALLHSSTMVKAGVFLVIKLAPVLGYNMAGIMVMAIGGLTFLLASFAAISQSNAKRVLAYSTIANLGLIVTCGGVGTEAAVWAGVLLIIFHAVTKSLMFLCVGTGEHHIGSRNIEDMDGLFTRMPQLAVLMMIGIAGMFLAPFGMLISKWAAMTSFVDSGNFFLVAVICFGSAATAFYWIKWLGKLSAVISLEHSDDHPVHKEESVAHVSLAAMAVILCILFPLLSKVVVIPYIVGIFGVTDVLNILTSSNLTIMSIMLASIVLMVVMFFGKTKKKIVPIYMAGVNMGDDLHYMGSMQQPVQQSLKNWYMEDFFGEKRMNLIGYASTLAVLVIVFSILFATVAGGIKPW